VITFTDHYSRFAFAWPLTAMLLWPLESFLGSSPRLPYLRQFVLTDNGSEFMKQFDEEIRRMHNHH
jgi:hypothetical protein